MSISFQTLKRGAAGIVCAVTWIGQPFATFAQEQEMKSPALAKELASLMTDAKLEAIALQHPEAPDQFVAAMLFPEVQLLMVTARHPSPDYLKWQIEQKQYKEVYGLLQQSGLKESRLFFQDLAADGLPAPGRDSVDVMYERGVQTLFDGDGKNGGSKEAYRQMLRDADEQYSRLLQLAINALQRSR
jgi:hypothetical protein